MTQAERISGWQENLIDDEMPPRWMWHLDWELEEHFELVKSKRASKYGTPEDAEEYENNDSNSAWDENIFASRFKE